MFLSHLVDHGDDRQLKINTRFMKGKRKKTTLEWNVNRFYTGNNSVIRYCQGGVYVASVPGSLHEPEGESLGTRLRCGSSWLVDPGK